MEINRELVLRLISKTDGKQKRLTLKESHEKYKDNKEYMENLQSGVRGIVTTRLAYVRSVNTWFYALIAALSVCSLFKNNTDPTYASDVFISTLSMNTIISVFIFVATIIIPWCARAIIRKYSLGPFEKRRFIFNNNLLDTSIIAMMNPFIVTNLVPNEDDIENLGGLVKHPLYESVSIDEEATIDEVRMVVMAHALKLCLFNALDTCIK